MSLMKKVKSMAEFTQCHHTDHLPNHVHQVHSNDEIPNFAVEVRNQLTLQPASDRRSNSVSPRIRESLDFQGGSNVQSKRINLLKDKFAAHFKQNN